MKLERSIRKLTCSQIVKFVEQGGDVNAEETYKRPSLGIRDRGLWATYSLLERAVEKGCAETVRFLIERGASLHDEPEMDFYVDVPLHRYRERISSLGLFYEEKEKLNGNCFLFLWANFFQNLEISQILYEAFVAPQEESLRRLTMIAAMNHCADIRNIPLAHFLLEHGGREVLSTTESSLTTVLLSCSYFRNGEITRFLLEQGADPNVMSFREQVPLIEAIANENEEVALALIEYGANLTICTKGRPNARPLSLAKRYKLKRVVAAIQAKLETSSKAHTQ